MRSAILYPILYFALFCCVTVPSTTMAADEGSSDGSSGGDSGSGSDNGGGSKDNSGGDNNDKNNDNGIKELTGPTKSSKDDKTPIAYCAAIGCPTPNDPKPSDPGSCNDDPKNCNDNDNFTSVGGHGHSGGSHLAFAKKSSKNLVQIPSRNTDFPDNDPSSIQVHATSAKKDVIGSYEINGEVTNVGNDTLQFVHITAHIFDAAGQLIGSGDGYTNPTDLDPQHSGTYNMFVSQDSLSGKPTSYRLSYDWN